MIKNDFVTPHTDPGFLYFWGTVSFLEETNIKSFFMKPNKKLSPLKIIIQTPGIKGSNRQLIKIIHTKQDFGLQRKI